MIVIKILLMLGVGVLLLFLMVNASVPPASLEAIPPEEDPVIMLSTGYQQVDVTIANLVTHIHSTTPTFLTHRMKTGENHVDVSGKTIAQLKAILADLSTGTRSYDYSTTGNKYFWDVMCSVYAQGYAYLKCIAAHDEPTMDSSSLIVMLRDYVMDGLTGKPMTFSHTDLHNLIESFSWGLNTVAGHFQWLLRFSRPWGLANQANFPKWNEKFDSLTTTQRNRLGNLFTIAFIEDMFHVFIVAMLQSDRANFSIGFLDETLLTRAPQELQTSLPDVWHLFNRYPKQTVGVPSSHTLWTQKWLDTDAVNGQTLEDSIDRYRHNFNAPDFSVKFARTMFGIGQVDSHGVQADFAMFLNASWGADEDWPTTDDIHHFPSGDITTQAFNFNSQGSKDYKYVKYWPLGYNTAIAQAYCDDVRYVKDFWMQALENRKHWSYDDIGKWQDGRWTKLNIFDSVSGMIEPSAYKSIRAIFGFMNYGNVLAVSTVTDPLDMITVDSNTVIIDRFASCDVDLKDKVPMTSPWVYGLLSQTAEWNQIYEILFPNLTDAELAMWIRNSMFFGRLKDLTDPAHIGHYAAMHMWYTRYHLVELIEHKTGKRHALMSSDGEQPRFESLAYPAGGVYNGATAGDYYEIADKYNCTVFKRQLPFDEITNASRPRNQDEHPFRMRNLGADRINGDGFILRAMVPVSGVGDAPPPPESGASEPNSGSTSDEDS